MSNDDPCFFHELLLAIERLKIAICKFSFFSLSTSQIALTVAPVVTTSSTNAIEVYFLTSLETEKVSIVFSLRSSLESFVWLFEFLILDKRPVLTGKRVIDEIPLANSSL